MNANTVPATSISQSFAALEAKRRQNKLQPQISDLFGALYVAVTTIILAYGGLFGFGSIVLMYLIWLPKINYKGKFMLQPTRDVVYVSLLAVLGILSSIWSAYPKVSAYTSLEYASLIVITIIVSRIVSTRAFIRGLILGSAIVLIASIASGRSGVDPFSGKHALVGLFGSKNMVGLFAEIGIFLTVLSFFMKQRFYEKVLFTYAPLCLFVLSIWMSKSASSVLSLFVILFALFSAVMIGKIPRSFRTMTFTFVIILVTSATALAIMYDAQTAILKSFGKNSTLTGRTHLWEEAIKSGMQAPYFGHGYSAFWVPGQRKAEQLWSEFGVVARVGFHFHNVFLEVFVELGMLGVAVVTFLIIGNCWKSIMLIIRRGMRIEYIYALGISVMFLVRAMVEVDIIGTFSIGPFLFYSVIPRLATYHREQEAIKQMSGVQVAPGSLNITQQPVFLQ